MQRHLLQKPQDEALKITYKNNVYGVELECAAKAS